MSCRPIRILAPLVALVAVLSCGGADGVAPPASITRASSPTLLAGVIVSGPVATQSVALDRIAAGGGAASGSAAGSVEATWVSMVPGTVPGGETATIVNLRTAQRTTVPVVEGGFDPQAMPASLGDTLQVAVSHPDLPDAVAYMAVAERKGPRIVRTRPPRGQTDAPLNTIITLVFSEPLDPASVNSTTVTLTTAGSPVAGAIRVVPGPGYTVEFTPTALLTPNTAYSLTVSGVVNLAGTPLAEPTSVPFTTSATTGSGGADWIDLTSQDRMVLAGESLLMRGYVMRAGAYGPDTLDWSVSNPWLATIDSTLEKNFIRIRTLSTGWTSIAARTRGPLRPLTASTKLLVLERSPLPAPDVVEDFHVVEWTSSYAPNQWFYAPQLSLRPAAGVSVVAIAIEIPGVSPAADCWSDYTLSNRGWTVFPQLGYEFGLDLSQKDRRATPGEEAVARITLRLDDGSGALLVVKGSIVGGSLPTQYVAGTYGGPWCQ